MPDKQQIRILCVEDHRIVREGISLIVGRQPALKVVGMAESGEEAIQMFKTHRPDVTLMDLRLHEMSGVEAIRAIRRIDPVARIVVLTMYQGDEDIFRALQAGATTYLLKDALADELIQVIRDVHLGKETAVSAQVKARLAERSEKPELTPREIEILNLIAQGLQNKEIASTLGISEATAQVHVKNILAKLEVRHRTAAVNVALRRGIVHIGS